MGVSMQLSQGVRFTVVTVVLNAENVIGRTIESVFNQTYLPYEYLIFDGCSTDGTLEIISGYKQRFEDKGIAFRYISEKDSGLYNAMNKGIKAATGDFVSFLNAGDWYQADALYNINAFYQEEHFDLTYGGLNYINPNGSVTIKMSKLDRFPVTSRHWNHPSMFLRREIYQKYGFDERIKILADFDLYLKLRKDGTKIRVIDKVITNFVADGVSTNVKLKNVLRRAKEKYGIYRANGFSSIYWIESYGWEVLKSLYFRLKS